jgi:chorismate mutase/prephenate dehydratase
MSDYANTVIGIQGGVGSFNEQAAKTYAATAESSIFNPEIKYLYTSENVMAAVENGEVDLGTAAIHNAIGGIVDETIHALAKHRVDVIGRIAIEITHSVMIKKGADFDKVDTLYAHPQVFAQCRHNLAKNFPKLHLISGEGDMIDTAEAARVLAEGGLPDTVGIIGPEVLADIYNFEIVERNQQDQKNNFTTFLIMKQRED